MSFWDKAHFNIQMMGQGTTLLIT